MTDADAQSVAGDALARLVVQIAIEVVVEVTDILFVARARHIADDTVLLACDDAAIVKTEVAEQEQILELAGVAVIEHLAQQADGHGIGRATRKLVEHLVLVEHDYIHLVLLAMQLSHTLGLCDKLVVGEDDHVGYSHAMQVLVLNHLIVVNLTQVARGIKSYILLG